MKQELWILGTRKSNTWNSNWRQGLGPFSTSLGYINNMKYLQKIVEKYDQVMIVSPNCYTFLSLYWSKRIVRHCKIMSQQIIFRISNWLLFIGKGVMQIPMKQIWVKKAYMVRSYVANIKITWNPVNQNVTWK